MGDENNSVLEPHITTKSVTVNKTRQALMQMSKVFSKFSQTNSSKEYAIRQELKKLEREEQQLKKQLYTKVEYIKEYRLQKPQTVCAALKCTKPYMVGILCFWNWILICRLL